MEQAGDHRPVAFVGEQRTSRFTPDQGGTLLSTETRVHATDPATRKAFRRYWLLVRAGSGLIRRDILRAVREVATTRETEQ